MSNSTSTYIGIYFEVPSALAGKNLRPDALSAKLGAEFESTGPTDQYWFPRDDEIGVRMGDDGRGCAVQLDVEKIQAIIDDARDEFEDLLLAFRNQYGVSLGMNYGCVQYPSA